MWNFRKIKLHTIAVWVLSDLKGWVKELLRSGPFTSHLTCYCCPPRQFCSSHAEFLSSPCLCLAFSCLLTWLTAHRLPACFPDAFPEFPQVDGVPLQGLRALRGRHCLSPTPALCLEVVSLWTLGSLGIRVPVLLSVWNLCSHCGHRQVRVRNG